MAILLSLPLAAEQGQAIPTFEKISVLPISYAEGQISQVMALPSGEFVVLDPRLSEADSQALLIFDAQGKSRPVAAKGRSPGALMAVEQVALDSKGVLWVADLLGRVSLFDLQGTLIDSFVVVKPSYNPQSVVLDEERGWFYLTGCVAKEFYINRGCFLVHRYRLKDFQFLESFVETDPEAVSNAWLGVEDYFLDIDANGNVFFADRPVQRLFRLSVDSGKVDVIPIQTEKMARMARLNPAETHAATVKAASEASLIEGLWVVDDKVLISVRQPKDSGYLLQIFDTHGRQLASDVALPGKLVGTGPDGDLFITAPDKSGLRVDRYRMKF